jgi:hypothetical protein
VIRDADQSLTKTRAYADGKKGRFEIGAPLRKTLVEKDCKISEYKVPDWKKKRKRGILIVPTRQDHDVRPT